MDRGSFYSGLGASIGASIPLPHAFQSLGRPDLSAIADGRPLADILARGGFPAVDIEVIRASEACGRLEVALGDLAERAREQEILRRKVTAAVVYPIAVAHGAIVAPWVIAWIFYSASPLALVAQLAALWAVILLVRILLTSSARDSLPILGSICREMSIARFCEALASGVDAAIPLRRSLELAASAAGGGIGRRARKASSDGIERPLAETLGGVLPPLALEMVRVGEESGSIDRSLRKVAQSHRDQAAHRLNKIVAVLPLLLFLVVAAIAAAVILSQALPDMSGRGTP